jgi:putative transposase
MPGPRPEKIELSEQERSELERVVAKHNVGQQTAQRARIILKAAEGKNHAEIGAELGISVDMACLWRRRWLALAPIELKDLSVEERLEDLPRSGVPPRLTADQICQMEQLACQMPEKAGRPISQWTGREIADEMIERGIVESISPRHAARLLKKGGFNRT